MPDSWYVVKVTRGREQLIARHIGWEVSRTGFEDEIRRILVLHQSPGYLLINMDLTNKAARLVRETAGVEDFAGAVGKPVPVETKEVVRMIGGEG